MEREMRPLTYQQASEVLGVSLETIKKAVLRGVLTRLPREGLYQHLMAGQVELFKGKTLSLSVLSEHDRKLWQTYADNMRISLQAHLSGHGSLSGDMTVTDESYSEVELTSAIAARIAALAVREKSPHMSEGLLILVLAELTVEDSLGVLDELDKQKREQAINQVVKSIAHPGDRFTVKRLLEDDAVITRLRTIHALVALS